MTLGMIAQAPANTTYLAAANEIFNKPEDGPWKTWTAELPTDGQYLSLEGVGPGGRVRELVGARRFTVLRAYSRLYRVKTWSVDGIKLDRKEVDLDKSGIMTRRLSDFLQTNKGFWGKVAVDTLISNPVGIDGVALLHDSHPNGVDGATWDNLTTDVLSPAALQAGVTAMAGLRLENGEPALMYPTHLMVGPALERLATDLVGANRPVPLAATGLEAYSSAVAAVAIQNWMAGRLQVIIEPRLADGTNDNNWYIMDLSKPGVRPVAYGAAGTPRAHAITDPSSDNVVHLDQYLYYVDGDGAWGGFAPHCIYGKTG